MPHAAPYIHTPPYISTTHIRYPSALITPSPLASRTILLHAPPFIPTLPPRCDSIANKPNTDTDRPSPAHSLTRQYIRQSA
ncbi:hypothetical protein LY76DRAFT_86113 [Colletotrichum caudatum]|nr:hypothetical protein LY76DRAFT_86113 [Colletotrichum caudatum]